jgi:hypothetical protein
MVVRKHDGHHDVSLPESVSYFVDNSRSGSGAVIVPETTIPHQGQEPLHKNNSLDSA